MREAVGAFPAVVVVVAAVAAKQAVSWGVRALLIML
jgi:hypothetical protein